MRSQKVNTDQQNLDNGRAVLGGQCIEGQSRRPRPLRHSNGPATDKGPLRKGGVITLGLTGSMGLDFLLTPFEIEDTCFNATIYCLTDKSSSMHLLNILGQETP